MTVVPHCPPVPAPSMASGLLDSWLDAGAAAVDGLGKCWSAAFERGPAAFDVPRWVALTAERRAPSWATPHGIVFEHELARLRDFSVSKRRVVPTLVLPPQAGHDSCIVDYSPEQSQMRTIVAAGLERALSLDWVGATAETADATVEDYVDVVDRAVEHCGGRVNLIGDCQGGWLATIYAALHPERVNTLTIAGAPIDFHAGEPVIHEVMRRVAPDGNLRFYEALVASGGGILRGRHMLMGFIMIQPGAEISRQIDLLLNLDDPAHVARYREFESWFKHTQDVPGQFYLWIVRNLFSDNALISGSLEVGGEKVDLGRIDMPLNLLAGATDHITPPDQVFALAEHASTPTDSVTRHTTRGGHLGLFMSHEALAEHWPRVLSAVVRRSRASAPASPGRPR
ncbi:MAG: alpha/beta fold hydrolase [Solirubrobacteraceae bacterium]